VVGVTNQSMNLLGELAAEEAAVAREEAENGQTSEPPAGGALEQFKGILKHAFTAQDRLREARAAAKATGAAGTEAGGIANAQDAKSDISAEQNTNAG